LLGNVFPAIDFLTIVRLAADRDVASYVSTHRVEKTLGSGGSLLLCFSGFHSDLFKEAVVMRRIVGLSLMCLVGCMVMSQLARAQDFSADVVNNKQGAGGMSKMYSTKDKVRWEMQKKSSGTGPSALIVDEAQGKWIMLMEQQHMYMDAMPMMLKIPVITQFWHVSDVNDACPQWKKIAEQTKTDKNWGSCAKVGGDTVNGRSTVKYEGVSSKGDKAYYWVDTKLKCVIKADSGSGSFDLQNIQEGSQPSSLFEIPAGYTKFDMGSMMQRPQ